MSVKLTGVDNKVYNIRLRCVDELNLPLQSLSILNCINSSYIMDIKDKLCNSDSKPELLKGRDNFCCHLLLPSQISSGKYNEPCAALPLPGWCVHGKMTVPRGVRPPTDAESNRFIAESDEGTYTPEGEDLLQQIHEEVRCSFAVDTLRVGHGDRAAAER